jgi:hypothetical protein
MAVDPNPKIYNAADDAEITAINFGTGDAGSYEDAEAGVEYHVWNDKGLVLGSSRMTSVKITVRDADGLEVENVTIQKWAEIKSTTIEIGADIGNGIGVLTDETDDDWPEFQAVGKENYATLGNIPANCYRVIFVRVNIPTSALGIGYTFNIYVTNQQPSSSIAKWITGLWGNGIVNGTHTLEVTDNAGADSKIDIDSGTALINDREVYLSVAQTYTISVVAGTYKIYLTSVGVISSTTGTIPTNSICLAYVTIAGGVVTTIVDYRNIYSFQNYNRIIAQHFQDMMAADPDGIHAAITGTGAEQEVTNGITNPDYARNMSITTTNIAAPSGNVIITGIVRGVSDTESIAIIAGTIAYGNKAFDTVTKITLPAGVTAADTVTVGFSDKIGLSSQINAISAVFKKKVNNTDKTSELTGKVSAVYHTVDCSPIAVYQDMELRYVRGDDGTWAETPDTGIGYTIPVQALTSSPADGATTYFGNLPKAPVTVAATSKIYIRKAGTIKIVEIYCYSGTAGTNESWSLSIRLNGTTDYLIAAVAAAANERIFSNTALSIAVVAGDYIEIKSVQPTWVTNPLTSIFSGYIYIEIN